MAWLDVYLKQHGVVPNEMYELPLHVAVLDREAGGSKVTFGVDMDSMEFIDLDSRCKQSQGYIISELSSSNARHTDWALVSSQFSMTYPGGLLRVMVCVFSMRVPVSNHKAAKKL